MTNLTDTIKNITFGLKSNYAFQGHQEPNIPKRGPSRWDEVKHDRSQYGDDFDFKILDENTNRPVFMPICNAALQWCYEKFPENVDRCDVGFIIHNPYWWIEYRDTDLQIILKAADRDGLLSEDEYHKAQQEFALQCAQHMGDEL